MPSERGKTTGIDQLNLSIFPDNSFKHYFKDNNINTIRNKGEILNYYHVHLPSFDYKNTNDYISLFHYSFFKREN